MLRAEVPVADILMLIAAADDSGFHYTEELWQIRSRMLKAVQDSLLEEID